MLRLVLTRATVFLLAFGAFLVSANAADVLVPHQGRLLDASDAPITGVRDVIYKIYEVPAGGAPLWTEMHPGVSIQNGLFDAMLGSITPLSSDIFRAPGSGGGGGGGFLARYLEVSVNGVVLSPRLRLGSVPAAAVSSSVSGDFESTPGQVTMGDTASGYYATFGEKVNQGLHAAGGALASGASLIASDCDNGDASFSVRHAQGVFANMLHMHARVDSAGLSSTYSDPTVETGMEQSSTADGASLSLTTNDNNMPNRISMNVTVPKQGSRLSLVTDLGDDGVEDNSVNLAADLTSSRVAIKTKGTGADANKTASLNVSATPGGSVSAISAVDLDGDDNPEGEISQSVTPTTCGVAIKTKGTGAEANKSASLTVSATPGGSVSAISAVDLDGDDDPESEISQFLTPTTCGVAINTKGTGAAKGRTIGSTCDDSSAVQVLELDDDGDGIVEGRGIVSVKSGTGSGSMSASSRLTCDPDEDGDPEGDISQIVTPTSCGVAINQKGTGADKNRTIGSTCDDSSAIQTLDIDDDGNGISEASAVSSVSSLSSGGGASSAAYAATGRLFTDPDEDGDPEGEISQTVTPTSCSVAIQTKGTGADKNRVIGSSVGDGGAFHYLDIDDDNDGILDRSIHSSVTNDDAQLLVSEGAAVVSLKTRKGGNVVGSINVNNGNLRMAELDGNGDGYLASSLGIGVDATHHIDVAGGAYCDGTNWVNASDKNSKENFRKVNGEELLGKIADLEITQWNYKNDKTTEHIGPTAQDFKEKFGVGSDGKSISTIDPSGIALAAIKELYKQFSDEMKQKDAQIEQLQKEMKKLQRELEKKKN